MRLGPNPESKVRTEALIHAEHGKIPVAILRLAGVYDDVCHSPPLANQIHRIFERQLASHLYSGDNGIPDNSVRTVTENSRTLKFSSHGRENE